MIKTVRNAVAAAAAASLVACAPAQQEAATEPAPSIPETQTVRNIVLVHGAFADGSGWRAVYDDLTARGYRVSVVQNPLTSFEDDVNSTRRILARQDGPAILVGHSYGGAVITETGVDPNVAGLVYVAAFAPDVGESLGALLAQIPPPGLVIDPSPDGFGFVDFATFKAGFAGDTTDADAAFMRDSQGPIALSIFETPVTQAAWRTRPVWSIVATQDRAIDPRLLRQMAERTGGEIVEVEASHVPYVTQPRAVADVIDRAARAVSEAAAPAPN
jgi:pimeloyl-ACP methyl ester carboxylesterase